jgi:hypothetical protein
MIEIINKPLLLQLVGYLYYWQMGFNSVFKGLRDAAKSKPNLSYWFSGDFKKRSTKKAWFIAVFLKFPSMAEPL